MYMYVQCTHQCTMYMYNSLYYVLCSAGNTALTYACCGGYEDVVKLLLDAGAEVEHQNENGHTPLMEAASCGHVGMHSSSLPLSSVFPVIYMYIHVPSSLSLSHTPSFFFLISHLPSLSLPLPLPTSLPLLSFHLSPSPSLPLPLFPSLPLSPSPSLPPSQAWLSCCWTTELTSTLTLMSSRRVHSLLPAIRDIWRWSNIYSMPVHSSHIHVHAIVYM